MSMKTTPERSNSTYSIHTPTIMPTAYVNAVNPQMATSPIKMNYRKSGSDKNIAGLRNDTVDSLPVSATSDRKNTEFDHSEIDRLIKEEQYEEMFTNVRILLFQ